MTTSPSARRRKLDVCEIAKVAHIEAREAGLQRHSRARELRGALVEKGARALALVLGGREQAERRGLERERVGRAADRSRRSRPRCSAPRRAARWRGSSASSSSSSASSSAAGTTRFTRPMRYASCASIISPVSSSCSARPLPTRRGSRCVPPYPGTSPSFTSGWPNFANSDAMRMWHAIASSQPPPSAKPFTAAIDGLGRRLEATEHVLSALGERLGRHGAVLLPTREMSAPATKARPAPVRMTPPTSAAFRALVDRVSELVDHAIVERVQLVGTVDRDRGDPVGDGEGQRFVGHARNLQARSRASSRSHGAGVGLAIRTFVTTWVRRLGSKTAGFRYVDARRARDRGSACASAVRCAARSPAWRDVHIAVSPRSAIQAWGFDARGRKQYRYNDRAVERRELRKYHRVRQLAKELPRIRRTLHADARPRAPAERTRRGHRRRDRAACDRRDVLPRRRGAVPARERNVRHHHAAQVARRSIRRYAYGLPIAARGTSANVRSSPTANWCGSSRVSFARRARRFRISARRPVARDDRA